MNSIAFEVKELRSVQETKNAQINDLTKLVEELQEKLELKEGEVKIKNREVSILKTEQDKLLKEIKKIQEQTCELKPYDTIPIPTPPN